MGLEELLAGAMFIGALACNSSNVSEDVPGISLVDGPVTDASIDVRYGMDIPGDSSEEAYVFKQIPNVQKAFNEDEFSAGRALIRINSPPTVGVISDRDGNDYTIRRVRVNTDTAYSTRVADRDGDPIECRFEFSDGYTRDWSDVCNTTYALNMVETYRLTVKARDDLREADAPATVELIVMANVPPVLNMPACLVRNPVDDLCEFTLTSGVEECWNISSSYDDDGSIVNYTLWPGNDTVVTSPRGNLCVTYDTPGTYDALFAVDDNEGYASTEWFYTIVL